MTSEDIYIIMALLGISSSVSTQMLANARKCGKAHAIVTNSPMGGTKDVYVHHGIKKDESGEEYSYYTIEIS